MAEDVGLFSASWLPMLCIEGWRITCVHRRCREVHCCHDCQCWPCCLRCGFRTCGWGCWPMRCGGCCRSQCLPRCCGRHSPLQDGCRCSPRGCCCGCRCHCGSQNGCHCGSGFRYDYHYYDCRCGFHDHVLPVDWACQSGVQRRSCHPCGCGHP